jgi:DNA polymerase III alpha subunit
MKNIDSFDSNGLAFLTNQGIVELAYQNKLDGALFEWQDADSKSHFENICEYLDTWPFRNNTDTNRRQWFTPQEYQDIDLDQYVLSRCKNQQQMSRARHELNIINQLQVQHIFKHLIYLVNLWRSRNLVWGIGRGSSVSCFVLYVIGLNKINPLDYDLDHREFFKSA